MGGCCASNSFNQLYAEYGKTFIKLMTIEKGKDVISDQFGKVKTQAQTTFGGFINEANVMADGKIGEVTKIYEDIKNKLNVGGVLQMVQNQKGQSIDDLSGFNKIKGQINRIKAEATTKIGEQKNNVFGQISKSHDDMIANLQKERPKLQLYERLPEEGKKVVRNIAEQQFASQLSENKDKIVSSIAGQFGPETFKKVFQQISPLPALKNLLSGAASNLTSEITKHLPSIGNIGGAIGNIGGTLGGFERGFF